MTYTDPRHLILTELFRTLDDALLSERGAGTERGMDRLLTYSSLYHAACPRPHTPQTRGKRPPTPSYCVTHPGLFPCISPYRELLRLTRRPGPLHAHNNELRWHLMQRHRWCERRPLEVLVRRGRYALAPNQAVLHDDGKAKRATRSSDKAIVIVETWSPRVDPTAVTLALDWLADNYTVPLQLPRELREAVAA